MGSFDNFAHSAIKKATRAKKQPAEPSMQQILDDAYDTHMARAEEFMRQNPEADIDHALKHTGEQLHQELIEKYPSYARMYGSPNLSQQIKAVTPRPQGNPFMDLQARNND